MSRFTVIIPVHNEAANIAPLHDEIVRELAGLDYAVVVVDDGSDDGTGDELARHAPEWTVIRTTRVGKTCALALALERVTTDRVVMMDGDLQDDTSAIPALLASVADGADCAVGRRANRCDGRFVKRIPSFFFNLYVSLLFGFRFLDINTGLKAFRTDALRRIAWFGNCHRFFPVLVFRDGGRVVQLPTHHRARNAGVAKFNSPLRFVGGFFQATLLRLGWRDGASAGRRILRALPVVAALLVGACCFHWVDREWPLGNSDAPAFVPPMLSCARGDGPVNTFQPSAAQWDPQGVGRQVGHGFLPALVNGALAPEATYRGVRLVIAGEILLGLLAYVSLLARVTPIRGPRAAHRAALHTLAVVATGDMLTHLEGRPEIFVFCVVAIALRVVVALGETGRSLVAGATLGLLAVTHPIAALFAGFAFLGRLAFSRSFWKHALLASAATLATLAAAFAAYPYPVADWVRGHLVHARESIVGFPPSSLLFRWFFDPTFGIPGALFFAVLAASLAFLAKNRRTLNHPALLVACVAAFLAGVWYFSLRQGFPVYNIDWITPFGIGVALAGIASLSSGKRLVAGVALAALMLPAAGCFVVEQWIRNERLASGPKPDEIREIVRILAPRPDAPGLIPGRFFQLFDGTEALRRTDKDRPQDGNADVAFLIVSQMDVRKPAPIALPGRRLVRSTYDPEPPSLFGVRLTGLARGFHYALYLPEGAPVPPALNNLTSGPHAAGSENKASSQ